MVDAVQSRLKPVPSIEDFERERVYSLFRAIVGVALGLTVILIIALFLTGAINPISLVLGAFVLVLQLVLIRTVSLTRLQSIDYHPLLGCHHRSRSAKRHATDRRCPQLCDGRFDGRIAIGLMVVLMAGLLLGWRATILFAVASTLAVLGLFWLTDQGVFERYNAGDFRLEGIWLIAVLCQSALVLVLAHRSIQQSFGHARTTQQALREQNARLEQEVTEHRRTQRQLLEAERARVEMEKEKAVVETRHRFISMVSHEFRTPLSIILSSKEMLQYYADRMDAEAKENHYSKISEQVSFMADMLNDVMMISKAQAKLLEFNPAPINLVDFLESHQSRGFLRKCHPTCRTPDRHSVTRLPVHQQLDRRLLPARRKTPQAYRLQPAE